MKYYQVLPKADQVRKFKNKTDILIANELYTEKELLKFTTPESQFANNNFKVIEVSKKQTYFLFGARFYNTKN
jgi:hypothetical protein